MDFSASQFGDYRSYLSAVRAHYSKGRRFSLMEWAKRLGYRSPQTLGMVLSGRRLPSNELVRRLSSQLGHPYSEQRHLELLVQLEKRRRKGLSTAETIEALRATKPQNPQIFLDAEAFSYIAQWYHLVIR